MTIDLDDPERMEYLTRQSMRLIVAAMDRQPDDCASILSDIGERYDAQGIWGICYALAATVHRLAFPSIQRGDGSLTGDMLAIEQLPGHDGDPAALWAARFVVAYVNGDSGTTNALFDGSMADLDQHMSGVVALVAMAGDIARHKEAESA